jgi:Kdo2-lipid IVA lauroyltransferase/acyltransferase
MARILIGKNRTLRRMTEQWTWLRSFFWRLEAWMFAGFLKICGAMDPVRASNFGRRLMTWIGPRQAKHKHVRRNLSLAFPQKSQAEIERLSAAVWGNMGAIFAEYGQLEEICRERLDVIVDPSIRTFQDPANHQAVFVSAHFGNWELLAAAISQQNVPITAVFTPLQNPYLDGILARQRQYLGCHLLPRDESMRPLIRELAQGRSIGLVMDQRVDSGRPVPLFGIDKLTTLIPARLALRHGAELVACCCERQDNGRFRITFFAPVVADDPEADEISRALSMSRKINAAFEDWIRKRPADWFCTKRRWAKNAVAANEKAVAANEKAVAATENAVVAGAEDVAASAEDSATVKSKIGPGAKPEA